MSISTYKQLLLFFIFIYLFIYLFFGGGQYIADWPYSVEIWINQLEINFGIVESSGNSGRWKNFKPIQFFRQTRWTEVLD